VTPLSLWSRLCQALASRPDEVPAWLELGELYWRAGKAAAAKLCFTQAAERAQLPKDRSATATHYEGTSEGVDQSP
jgi:cytochrome c-type biogenesis protein CcmH/NrfG